MTKYQVVGLPNPIELSFPLAHDIIPKTQTNQRPGIPRQTPGFWVQHETANTSVGADAAMHNRFLQQGAPNDQGVSQQLSYHFTVDDGIAYQMIPVDEVTWQAADGGGPGNMSGISCELCVNADGDKAKSRANAEELCAAICKAEGLGADRVKRHWDFNGGNAPSQRHHCPDVMMSENYWPTFVANVAKRLAGTPQPPATVEPSPIWWEPGDVGPVKRDSDGAVALAMLGEVTAKRTVPLRKDADAKAPKVGEVQQGKTAKIVGTYKGSRSWVFVEIEPGKYGRGLLSAFSPYFPTT